MKRVPELDALRGLAAIGVVLFHAFPRTFFLGWCLVDLFFVLSAYLITSILLRHLDSPHLLRSFYARRALRIWPLYYTVLLGVVVLNGLAPRGFPAEGLWQQATFTQNVQGIWFAERPIFVQAFEPSWSLAVEEQFYVLWPLVLLAFGRGAIVPAAFAAIATGVLCRSAGMAINVFPTRCDGIAAGALLALLLEGHESLDPARRGRLVRGFTAALCAGGAYAIGFAVMAWGRTEALLPGVTVAMLALLHFGVVGLTILFAGRPALRLLRIEPLVYAGAISYGLYLLHTPIMAYTGPVLGRLGVTGGLVVPMTVWSLIVLLPMASYHLLEQPLFDLKERFPYEARAEVPSPLEARPASP